MDISKAFPERIKKLREGRGLSQELVSNKIGIERQTLGNYEKGKRKPDIEVLAQIKRFYGVDYEYLLGETNYQTKTIQDELQNDFSFALSFLPQDMQTCIVRSLNEITNAIFTFEISEEESECGKIFETLLLFISSTIALYSAVRSETVKFAETLEKYNEISADRAQLLEIKVHKFYINAMQGKEKAAAAMSEFIDKMQGVLFSDTMQPFDKEV